MRNSKGQFIKGHASARKKLKALEVITWSCVGCGKTVSKTREEIHWRKKKPKYCSIQCVYENNPRKGATTPQHVKDKLSKQKIGKKNPCWAGGVTPMRVKLRNTPEYKKWRRQVYERDDYTCKICGTKGVKLEADHIIPYMTDKERLLDINNGQTLCKKCHRVKTTEELKANWKNQYGKAN